jgi:hypothetical protein
MNPKKSLAVLMAMMAVVGCSLNRNNELRRDSLLARIGGGGQVIEPKRSLLTVVLLSRPVGDPVINEAVWRTADEQAVGPEARRAWQINGLRIGLITGELPPEVEAVVKAPPPHKVDPTQILLAEGENSLFTLCPKVPEANLLLNLQGQPFGRDFKDACGFIRATANQEGALGVALRLVPEIHHGPFQHTVGAVPNSVGLAPQQLTFKDGQKEETLRELSASLTLKPNQIAVIGGYANRPRSLGSFLFTQLEPNSDRVLQTIVLVWARQNQPDRTQSDPRPKLLPVDPPAEKS